MEITFPELRIIPAAAIFEEKEGSLLTFKIPVLDCFSKTEKKALHVTCVKVSHSPSLGGVKDSKLQEFFGSGSSPKGCWRALYKPPIEKRSGDLQWRVVHGSLVYVGQFTQTPTNTFMCRIRVCRNTNSQYRVAISITLKRRTGESVDEIKLIRFSCIFIMGNSQASRDGDFSPECSSVQQKSSNPESSCVSVKTDSSMGQPINFKSGDKWPDLRLWDCGVTDESCFALAAALRLNPAHLRDLHLSENYLGD
ncbi:hypothetical protein F2P79_018859 [Pimephales promelas]|nr:hypothetical protein F2P79_018859 [Pimephales promelas]